ncbi:hypothetical protein [Xylella fastidiosa]|uniref:hypothetical protein n=1 Tax=Xylella fastidiosa TaxID=2371 RepID=UPI0028806259|nr:hypothetical protein [Xylella fastidiosa]
MLVPDLCPTRRTILTQGLPNPASSQLFSTTYLPTYLPACLPAWMDGWIQFQTRAMTPSVALAAPRITLTDQSSVAILSIGALRCRLSPVTPNANRPPSPVMIRCRFLPSVPQSLSFSPVY